MRILLVGYIHGQGGIQTHTHWLADGLAARCHSVVVLSPPPRPEHAGIPDAARSYALDTYRDLAGAVRAARKARPDVVVVAGTGFRAMLAALAAAGARRVFFEVMSGARAKALDPRLLVHLGFHAVVGQGQAVARRFCAAFGWRGRVAVIPALPEPLAAAPPPPAPPGPRAARCAAFGRLAAHKNLSFLVERWDAISCSATLDIWGSGPEAGALARAVAARADGRIRLCGRYPSGAAYVALLQSYDLTLLPTVGDEGAPLVLLEAMAAGVPFVANGVGGIADYANPDCAVTGGDIAHFVPAVRDMLARLGAGDVDPARLQRHYVQTYAPARLVARWEGFLAALARPGGPAPAAAEAPPGPAGTPAPPGDRAGARALSGHAQAQAVPSGHAAPAPSGHAAHAAPGDAAHAPPVPPGEGPAARRPAAAPAAAGQAAYGAAGPADR